MPPLAHSAADNATSAQISGTGIGLWFWKARWYLRGLGCALLVLLFSSREFDIGWGTQFSDKVFITRGMFYWLYQDVSSRTDRAKENGWPNIDRNWFFICRWRRYPSIEWLGDFTSGPGQTYGIPIWLVAGPLLVMGDAASILRLIRRRYPSHCCQSCGYDLRSLSVARCPECGGGTSAR